MFLLSFFVFYCPQDATRLKEVKSEGPSDAL